MKVFGVFTKIFEPLPRSVDAFPSDTGLRRYNGYPVMYNRDRFPHRFLREVEWVRTDKWFLNQTDVRLWDRIKDVENVDINFNQVSVMDMSHNVGRGNKVDHILYLPGDSQWDQYDVEGVEGCRVALVPVKYIQWISMASREYYNSPTVVIRRRSKSTLLKKV